MTRSRAVFLLILGFAAFASSDALAAAGCSLPAPKTPDEVPGIMETFKACAKGWEATFRSYATSLFWLLAAIEFTWNALRLVFRNAGLDEFLSELVNQIFFIGFFFLLLTSSTEWAGAITGSFTKAANDAVGIDLAGSGVSGIFGAGLDIAAHIWGASSYLDPAGAIAYALAALIVLIIYALMTAAIVLALAESYIVISAGVLFMGFGGSRWTKDFALKIFVYAVSVGAKLFLMTLIAGLGLQIVKTYSQFPILDTRTGWIILGVSLILLVLMKALPDMIQGLINGTSLGVNHGLLPAIGQLGAALYGLGMVIQGASELAREQIAEEKAKAQKEGGQLSPGGSIGKRAAGLAGKAALRNIGERISGRRGAGTYPGQTAAIMRDETAAIRKRRDEEERQASRAAPQAAPSQQPADAARQPPSPPPVPGETQAPNPPPEPGNGNGSKT